MPLYWHIFLAKSFMSVVLISGWSGIANPSSVYALLHIGGLCATLLARCFTLRSGTLTASFEVVSYSAFSFATLKVLTSDSLVSFAPWCLSRSLQVHSTNVRLHSAYPRATLLMNQLSITLPTSHPVSRAITLRVWLGIQLVGWLRSHLL